MARITVEDCIDKFPSRFELVLVASNRARKLHAGDTPTVEKDNDKNTVIALREIAEQKLSKDDLKIKLIEEYQTATLILDDESEEFDENSVETELEENNNVGDGENKENDNSSKIDDLENNNLEGGSVNENESSDYTNTTSKEDLID